MRSNQGRKDNITLCARNACRLLLTVFLISSCEKWDFDRVGFTKVITIGAIEVNATGAFLLGDIENIRQSTIEKTGFLLSSSAIDESNFRINNPDLVNYLSAKQSPSQDNRAFATPVADLESGNTYFFRAYGLLMNLENPIYGAIDSFTTTGFNISIEDINRLGSNCPTQANIRLKVGITGSVPSSVEFGIVWHQDLFSDPTLDDQVIYGDQVDQQGFSNIGLPVNCSEFYRVRPFIRLSGDVLYTRAVEFTAQVGGKWYYVGEIPQRFIRSQGLRSISSSENGYILGLKNEGIFQAAFLRFDPTTLVWSEINNLGFGSTMWVPSASERILLADVGGGLQEYHPDRDEWEFLGAYQTDGLIQRRSGFIFENKMYFLFRGMFGFVQLSDVGTFIGLQPNPGENLLTVFRARSKGYALSFSDFSLAERADMWEFDLISDSWKPVAPLPEVLVPDLFFSMNGKGYVLTGVDEEQNPHPGFWEYDPELDEWARLADFGRGDGNADIGFVADGIAYGGLGISFEGEERQEFWKYVQELK